ncbi:hypothetical protein E2C01_073636 [Portunus trituberculatus]|uniref:Uncharacterized protein n=1 Tax=Portunus trituberculatus TaxID=210409 RepID=A0A5B7I9Z0_PORTR|nr:hypothetical protein [Portunus trituberculatus]
MGVAPPDPCCSGGSSASTNTPALAPHRGEGEGHAISLWPQQLAQWVEGRICRSESCTVRRHASSGQRSDSHAQRHHYSYHTCSSSWSLHFLHKT